QLPRLGHLAENVEPEPADRGLARGIPQQPDASEAARIAKREACAVVGLQLELPIARTLGGGAVDPERTAHAEMEGGPGPAVQLEPEMLALPAHRLHAAAAQRRGQTPPAHARVDDGVVDGRHPDDAAPGEGARGELAR